MAPDEERALKALQSVQSLSAPELDQLIDGEIGKPMLGVFSALARAFDESSSDEDIARRVHLVVLGYLLHREVEKQA